MKRLLISLAALAAVTSLQATGVVGSSHDLSASNGKGTVTSTAVQVCMFCHAPHVRTGTAFSSYKMLVPLWNHGTTTTTWDATNIYTSPTGTLQGTIDKDLYGAPSVACLSCHDGTLSLAQGIRGPMGVYGGALYTFTGTDVDNTSGKLLKHVWGTAAAVGTGIAGANSLAMVHPVGISYTGKMVAGTNANPELKPYDTVVNAKIVMVGGTPTVQCGSCHEPHDNGMAGETAFLRDSMTKSALCTDCHNK